MQIDSKTLLCRYQYDALNRLVASTPSAQDDTQSFYLKDRLTTEIQGAEQRSMMQHEDQLLAQQQRQSGTVETRLLATDQQRSVLNILAAARPNLLAYTPYGHRHPENGLLSLLGFNGERPDPVTGCYLLGNGYRAFNPVLMRFNSPDSWSPFGKGGVNAYAYCEGNPVSRVDSTGHFWELVRVALKNRTLLKSRPAVAILPASVSTAISTKAHRIDLQKMALKRKYDAAFSESTDTTQKKILRSPPSNPTYRIQKTISDTLQRGGHNLEELTLNVIPNNERFRLTNSIASNSSLAKLLKTNETANTHNNPTTRSYINFRAEFKKTVNFPEFLQKARTNTLPGVDTLHLPEHLMSFIRTGQ